MHRSRIVVLVGAALAAGSLPLPFMRRPEFGTTNGLEGDAWPVLLLLAPVVIFAAFGDRAEGSGPIGAITSIGFSGLAVLFAVVKLTDAATAVRNIDEGGIGVGAWVLVAASLVVLTGTGLGLSRRVA
ncbi:MAG: hypothetical protein ACE5KX_02440 [Acidimicrobiia bacterium]